MNNCVEFLHENSNIIFILIFQYFYALSKLWKPGDIFANIKEASLLSIPLVLSFLSLSDIEILDFFISKIKRKISKIRRAKIEKKKVFEHLSKSEKKEDKEELENLKSKVQI